jgi:hypothetical protein
MGRGLSTLSYSHKGFSTFCTILEVLFYGISHLEKSKKIGYDIDTKR